MAAKKYDKYILREPVREPALKKRAVFQAISGKEELWPGIGGINCNFAFGCVAEPYLLPDPPHKHEYDEFLVFLGGNPENMADFDAEVEIALGEEWEKNIVNTTAIVYIPRGLQHCPINIKRVGKPFLFGHILLGAKYALV